jgi:hypothetical protein
VKATPSRFVNHAAVKHPRTRNGGPNGIGPEPAHPRLVFGNERRAGKPEVWPGRLQHGAQRAQIAVDGGWLGAARACLPEREHVSIPDSPHRHCQKIGRERLHGLRRRDSAADRVGALAAGLQIGHVELEQTLERRRPGALLLFPGRLRLQVAEQLALGVARLFLRTAHLRSPATLVGDAGEPDLLRAVDDRVADGHGSGSSGLTGKAC